MQGRSKAAKRYAIALLELADESAQRDAVRADLTALQALTRECPDFARFLADSHLPRSVREGVVAKLFEGRVHPLTLQFVFFLDSKRRLRLFEEVCRCFIDYDDQKRGIAKGRLAAPFDLAPDTVQRIREWTQSRIPGQLDLAVCSDPDLYGGFRLQVGSMVYDFSLAAQLRMLKDEMVRV